MKIWRSKIRVQVGASALSGVREMKTKCASAGCADAGRAAAAGVRRERRTDVLRRRIVELHAGNRRIQEARRTGGSHPFQLTTTFNLNGALRARGGSLNEQLPSAPGHCRRTSSSSCRQDSSATSTPYPTCRPSSPARTVKKNRTRVQTTPPLAWRRPPSTSRTAFTSTPSRSRSSTWRRKLENRRGSGSPSITFR